MYNVTMGRVRVTIVVVENQYVTYYEFAFVAVGIQRAMCTRHIVICVLPGSAMFFHIIS